MRYHNITKDDMLNGDGLRAVLWVAGCNHYCKNCQNPITWDPQGGLLFDEKAKAELFTYVRFNDYVSGVTFSGGDPLYPGNREEITELAKAIKNISGKTVWMYTGYMWEEVKDLPVMEYVDVLVDGEYQEELRDVKYEWAGSTNQRVIDVQESLKRGEVILHGVQEQSRTPEGEETGGESK